MSNPDAYVREIKSLSNEIKRSNERLNTLRKQRKSKQLLLFKYMEEHNLEKYEGITINSIRPRGPIKRKPEVEKRKDAVELFRQVGIGNPEEFYIEFKNTQRLVSLQNEDEEMRDFPKRSKKKKADQDFDPFLGYYLA